jgi:opacity protein-like surface antigen
MSRKGQMLLVGSLLVFLAASACAQESLWWDKKNEVGFLLGRDFASGHAIKSPALPPPFTDNRVNIGKGLAFQGNYGRVLRSGELVAYTFEVPVVYLRDQDLNSSNDLIPEEYKALFVTPGVRASLFPNTLVSPWVAAGGGFGRFTTSKNGVYNVLKVPGKSSTTSVFQFGLGLDVKVWRLLKVRAEVRDFYSGVPDLNVDQGRTRMHNFVIGSGVVWTF